MKYRFLTAIPLFVLPLVLYGQTSSVPPAPVAPSKVPSRLTPEEEQTRAEIRRLENDLAIALIGKKEESPSPTRERRDETTVAVDLGDLYAWTAENSRVARFWVAEEVGEFVSSKILARSAAQVSQLADEVGVRLQALQTMQNLRLIQQNDRIIALLEVLARKK